MLEKYFVKPQTVDRVRACWIGAEIERYVEWLCAREYAARRCGTGCRSWSSSVSSPALAALMRWRTYRFMSMRLWRSGLRGNNVRIAVVTTNGWPRRCVARSSRCCAGRSRLRAAAVGRIDGPVRRRGAGVLRVLGRRARASAGLDLMPTGTTWTASRPT